MIVKVDQIEKYSILFSDGSSLTSEHDLDWCERHYLDFSNLSLKDFEGLEFDLSNDDFFERIPDYGIALKPIKGWPVRIPAYGYNNGYYSDRLSLELSKVRGSTRVYDITECQIIDG